MGSDREYLVYKSNELIEGKYSLSVVAQKIAASIISKVDPTGQDPLPMFKMTLRELSQLSGISDRVLRRALSEYTKELKAIVVELRKPGSFSYVQLGLFREFTFDNDDRHLHIQFEEKLEPHIRDFSGNFTRYQLKQLKDLNSGYSVRLYEILRKAHNAGKSRRSVTYYQKSIDDLRAMLGIPAGHYRNRFDHFRRRVLETAQKELEEKTDIRFGWIPVRHGRQYGAIKFEVFHNTRFETVEGGTIVAAQNTLSESSSLPLQASKNISQCVERSNLLEKRELPPIAKGDTESAVSGFSQEKFRKIKTAIPSLEDDLVVFLSQNYEEKIINDALLAYMQAVVSGKNIEKPGSFLVGILRKQQATAESRQRTDEAVAKAKTAGIKNNFTTEEMLDKSWADRWDFDFD